MSAPFFKFSAVEWIAGAVQAVDYAERGIFIELCARTWMQGAPLQRGEKLARLLHISGDDLEEMLKELASLDIVELAEDGSIRIKFLAHQADEIAAVSEAAREKANARWKREAKASDCNAPPMQMQCTGNADAKQVQCNKDKDKDKDIKESVLTDAKEKPDASAPPSSFERPPKKGGTVLVAVNPMGESSFVKSYMKAADFSKWGETEFRASVAEAVKAHPEYAADVEDFARYWLEPDKTGKPRFALQKTWATGGRLATWHQRSLNDRNGKGRQPLNAAGEGEWRI